MSILPRATLCLAVLLAGCGAAPTGDAPAGEADTLTPVAVPTDPPTPTGTSAAPTERELAPGVTGAGVEDPVALAAAHRRGLLERPYRLDRTLSVARPDGTLLRRTTRRAAVGPNASRYRLVDTVRETDAYPVSAVPPRVELWWADGRALIRLSGDGEVRYRRVDGVGPTEPVGDLTLRDRIAGLLTTTETTVVGREPGDPVRVILVAGDVRSDSMLRVPALLERPRNVTFALEVDTNGVVREYRLEYDATLDGERVRVRRRVEFAFLEGPVEPPAWRERALNATGTTGGPDTPGS